MATPSTHISAFTFYVDKLDDLQAKMDSEVGYHVTPNKVWSLNIEPFEGKQWVVTVCITYWKAPSGK